jgi:hypothetical protein
MKQQENNFKYNNIINIGYWIKNFPELNNKSLFKLLYEIQHNTPSVFKSNNGGYQTPSNLNSNSNFYFLINFLNNIIFNLTQNPNIKVNGIWGNISSFTNSNKIHTHSEEPNHLSGILYLKVPPQSGDLVFYNPLDINNFYTYTPQEKDLIIFPSITPHSVEPNLSQEDRISIAFNFS